MKMYKSLVVLFTLVSLSSWGYADNNISIQKSPSTTEINTSIFDMSIFDEVDAKIAEAEKAKAENEALGSMEDIIAENEKVKNLLLSK